MRFEEAYTGWQERRLTREDAAELLGMCERSFRRYIDRYEEAGMEGLIDKRIGEVSHRVVIEIPHPARLELRGGQFGGKLVQFRLLASAHFCCVFDCASLLCLFLIPC
ncbi:MAG: helix-turn-helix domain-containing protein [Gammaproteobacteria bacterium]|nr:helix-turn-helix domain-containing protein [Gammaproteobacteria bacterium]